MKTLAQLIYEKTRWTLKDYCEMRGIGSMMGLRGGYVSKANAKILESDGIEWRTAKNVKIGDGTCAGFIYLNKKKASAYYEPKTTGREADRIFRICCFRRALLAAKSR